MRKDPDVTDAYKKDPEGEKFLLKLNEILSPYQEEDYKDLPELHPTVHIIGVPRSGTTLLSQLITSCLDIGYINNLIAAFWRAPVYGIYLSKKLIPRKTNSSFTSAFGRTSGPHEPHEFGYFWFSRLCYGEMMQQDEDFEKRIDWEKLRLILINMTHAYECPIIFKNFLTGWHIAKMQEILPKTCFIWITRDPLENAMSLLYTRREFLGSFEKWASMKPTEYAWLKREPYWLQVAGQVYFLEKSFTEQIRKVKGRNVLEITYEDLCRSPVHVLEQVIDLIKMTGGQTKMIQKPQNCFKPTHVKDIADDIREKVKNALDDYYRQST